MPHFLLSLVWLLALLSTPAPVIAADLQVVRNWPQLPAGEILGQVAGIACDSRDNVWVFHRGSRVWIQDPATAAPISEAVVYCFDGKTGELKARWGADTFVLPHGLFIDQRDHLWLTDVGRHQVYEYKADGTLLRTFGVNRIGGNDERHFNKPTDVAVLADGSFYVSDGYINSRVVKFSADGKFQFQWGNPGTGSAQFVLPHAVTLDRTGQVYVADRQNDRIQVFTPEGKYVREIKTSAMGRPYGVRIGRDGLLYVADGGEQPKSPPNRSGLAVLDLNGKLVAQFGRWGNHDGQFMMAHAIAHSSSGEIYVGDINGQRVQKLRWTAP